MSNFRSPSESLNQNTLAYEGAGRCATDVSPEGGATLLYASAESEADGGTLLTSASGRLHYYVSPEGGGTLLYGSAESEADGGTLIV